MVFKLIDLENKKTSRVGLVPKRGIMSPAYIRLTPRLRVVSKYFFYYYYSLYLTYVFNNIAGEGVRANLNPKELLEIAVPFPGYDSQERISNYIDKETAKIDTLIAKQERLLELLEEKRRTTITCAVHPSINTTEERFRDICVLNPATNSKFDDTDIVNFYPMESIGDDGTIKHSQSRPYLAVKTGYTVFQNNDVTIAKVTPCFENYKGAHMINIASEVGFGTTELFVLRANSKVTPEYLYWLTQAQDFNNYLAGGMRGTGGLKRVVPEELKNYKVSIPEVDIQKQIIATLLEDLKKFERVKQKTKKQIDLLKERRLSLISNVATGKVKV